MSNGNPINQGEFTQRWAFFPIAAASRNFFELGPASAQIAEFRKIADEFYHSVARMYPLWRKIRPWVKKYIYFWASEQEKAVLGHPLGKQLFGIWLENVGGKRYGMRADIEEKIGFFKYLFMNLNIAHNPALKEKFTNYQNLNFFLKLLRPNIESHIYLTQSFVNRPINKMIRQYLEMAVITGDYEMILRRFPLYHNMLWLNPAPGDRMLLDTREGFDLAIIYKLPVKYNLALELDKVQTRSTNRFITCVAVEDPKQEQEKQAEAEKMAKELKACDDGPVDFRDGRVWKKDGSEVFAYGPRRQRAMQLQAELNLLKANPRPGSDSSLIVRFQLLQPAEVLLEGLNRKREISLEEVEYVWKVLDIQEGEIKKPEKDRRSIGQIITDVFANPNLPGVKPDTLAILSEVKRIRAEVCQEDIEEIRKKAQEEISRLGQSAPEDKIRKIRNTEEDKIRWVQKDAEDQAWQFLISRLLEGKAKPLLHAMCLRLMTDGFDLVFSLWPLLTGKELSISEAGEVQIFGEETQQIEEKRENSNDARKVEKKRQIARISKTKTSGGSSSKTVLPLLDFPKGDLEDLIKGIFNKYLDISAATARARSEPRLAALVLEYCLKPKSNPYVFREKLTRHLRDHYEIHYNFLEEYIKSDKRRDENPSVLKHIHKLKLRPATPADHQNAQKLEPQNYVIDWAKVHEQIDQDVEGIMEKINTVRERLYSPSGCSRLLCFIDPVSVEVQIGDFYYEGKGLGEEEEFIAKQQELQFELSKAESAKRAEVEKFDIERKGTKQLAMMKLVMLDGKRKMAEKEASTLRDITEYDLRKAFSEAKLQAVEKLKAGDINAYAKLSLIKAHYEGGIQAVEEILEKSPNLLRAISPDQYKMMMLTKVKQRLVGILEKNPDQIDRVTVAMLLSQDFKDIVASDLHKDLNKIFADIIKNIRYVMPHIPMSGMQGMREPNQPQQGRALEMGTGQENETQSETVEIFPHTDGDSGGEN